MANTYCQDGYCDLAKKTNEEKKLSDKLAFAVPALFVILYSIVTWYAATHGITVDPTYLP